MYRPPALGERPDIESMSDPSIWSLSSHVPMLHCASRSPLSAYDLHIFTPVARATLPLEHFCFDGAGDGDRDGVGDGEKLGTGTGDGVGGRGRGWGWGRG